MDLTQDMACVTGEFILEAEPQAEPDTMTTNQQALTREGAKRR
jgi:hypothetical protein